MTTSSTVAIDNTFLGDCRNNLSVERVFDKHRMEQFDITQLLEFHYDDRFVDSRNIALRKYYVARILAHGENSMK